MCVYAAGSLAVEGEREQFAHKKKTILAGHWVCGGALPESFRHKAMLLENPSVNWDVVNRSPHKDMATSYLSTLIDLDEKDRAMMALMSANMPVKECVDEMQHSAIKLAAGALGFVKQYGHKIDAVEYFVSDLLYLPVDKHVHEDSLKAAQKELRGLYEDLYETAQGFCPKKVSHFMAQDLASLAVINGSFTHLQKMRLLADLRDFKPDSGDDDISMSPAFAAVNTHLREASAYIFSIDMDTRRQRLSLNEGRMNNTVNILYWMELCFKDALFHVTMDRAFSLLQRQGSRALAELESVLEGTHLGGL